MSGPSIVNTNDLLPDERQSLSETTAFFRVLPDNPTTGEIGSIPTHIIDISHQKRTFRFTISTEDPGPFEAAFLALPTVWGQMHGPTYNAQKNGPVVGFVLGFKVGGTPKKDKLKWFDLDNVDWH